MHESAARNMVHMNSEELTRTISYWNAANYLTAAQIYLRDNPLLREQLTADHIKPRLLGHWGTSPGLNLIYAHLNHLIKETGREVLYIAGPGHGGPALVANVYLEGTYSEIYPTVSEDTDGLTRLVRQFSTPGGIPSHVSVPTPGSIHEGGELGYALVHAFGVAFDNPDLMVACVIGDGEAETGPLAASWKSIDFLNPARDGAVLPILHCNGYKISGPTTFGRASDEQLSAFLRGAGYEPFFVEGSDVTAVHEQFAEVLQQCHDRITDIQQTARLHGVTGRPAWPAIILRTPKGWTGPAEVDDQHIEGTFRSHQVPLSTVRENPDHLAMLETWLRSYKPDELFDDNGRLVYELREMAPKGDQRMGATPHANGGRIRVPLTIPDISKYATEVTEPGVVRKESTRALGEMMRDIFDRNREQANFRLFCPDETNSNRLGPVFDVENRTWMLPIEPHDDHLSPDGRVMEVLSEHLCQGWLEGYVLSGRHGVFATYEAFAMVSSSMVVQHAKWIEEGERLQWRQPVASLNVLLTSTCWRNDHNGFSHQGPGYINVIMSMRGSVSRVYLPPDANTLLAVSDHCLRTTDRVNLIVIDKQPQLQYLNLQAAKDHVAAGASIWEWAGNNDIDNEPDIVLACSGDVVTMETLAAAEILAERLPDMKIRVVNVVDLMKLAWPDKHPHGLTERDFAELFTDNTDVVFAFHGYAQSLHQLLHGRPDANRFHVRGFIEQGTTTTPFDMVVLNGVSRYHLAAEAIRRSRRVPMGGQAVLDFCEAQLTRHQNYVRDQLEDIPEVRDWTWKNRRP
jgi:xylulose-5-phosphate/fructose-6-phosphate phosphoketolase